MKILTISDMYPKDERSTSGTFVRAQVRAVSQEGIDTRVLCPIPRLTSATNIKQCLSQHKVNGGKRIMDDIEINDVLYWNLPLRLSVDFVIQSMYQALYKSVKEIHKEFKFEIIHAHRVFPIGYVALLIAKKLGVPAIVTAHGSDIHTNPDKNSGIKKYTIKTIEEADHIVTVSNNLLEQINQLATPKNAVKIVYNGVNSDEFTPIADKISIRQKFDLPLEGQGICTVSRLVKQKGLIELIQAFKGISKDFPKSWLLIVGDGPLKEDLTQLIEQKSLSKRVFLAGPQPHAEISSWMSAADIFTLPSYNEGLPVVILEAMSCGLPVVASTVGGIPEIIQDEQTGLLIKARQVKPLQDALARLLGNPDLHKHITLKAQKMISERFQWSDSAKSLRQIYLTTKNGQKI